MKTLSDDEMDETKARTILEDSMVEIEEDGGLNSVGWYLTWTPGENTAKLDGDYTATELEAIAWWMRKHKREAGHGR